MYSYLTEEYYTFAICAYCCCVVSMYITVFVGYALCMLNIGLMCLSLSLPTSFHWCECTRNEYVWWWWWWWQWSLVAVGISCSHVLCYFLLFSQYNTHWLTNMSVCVCVYLCLVAAGDVRVRTPRMNRKCHNFSINSSTFIMPLPFILILILFVFYLLFCFFFFFKEKKGYFSIC